MITRRRFFKMALTGGIGALSLPLLGAYDASKFQFSQLIYRGNWDPRPRAFRRLVSSLDLRTSVKTSFERKTLEIGDEDFFYYPFIYLAGEGEFEPFTGQQRKRLRRFLQLGGTILVDDVSGVQDSTFDSQIRNEFVEILPRFPVSPIPSEHVIYKSFYLLNSPSGRKIISPYLEGITFPEEERTCVVYSRNDLGGAWSEDEFGKWQYECVPGGESQRELAFRLGINIVLYSLTGNYKEDQIHSPFIKRRQMNL